MHAEHIYQAARQPISRTPWPLRLERRAWSVWPAGSVQAHQVNLYIDRPSGKRGRVGTEPIAARQGFGP